MASPIYAPDWINTLYNPPGSYAGGGYAPSSTRNAYSQVGTGYQAAAGTLSNPRMDYLNMLYQPNSTREPVETQAPIMPVIQAPGSVTGTTPVKSPVDAIANKYLPQTQPTTTPYTPTSPQPDVIRGTPNNQGIWSPGPEYFKQLTEQRTREGRDIYTGNLPDDPVVRAAFQRLYPNRDWGEFLRDPSTTDEYNRLKNSQPNLQNDTNRYQNILNTLKEDATEKPGYYYIDDPGSEMWNARTAFRNYSNLLNAYQTENDSQKKQWYKEQLDQFKMPDKTS